VEACRTIAGGGLIEIELHSLDASEVQKLAASLLESESLPEAAQKLILERAEGNPLFVEELVSLLMEKGLLMREDGRLYASRDLAAISLPDNLVRMMLARIDRLPDEPKRTLRVASVIGRQFLLQTLKDVLIRIGQAESQPRLMSQLSELEFTSLIQLAATRPEIGYLFRHALVQEAAYEAVLKADRRWVHRATAEALENSYPDRLDELAPSLAYHFERGEASQKALHYFERAGDRAHHTYANAEAIAFYQAAIERADSLKRENQPGFDPQQNVTLRKKLGDILLRVGQHEAARTVYDEALTGLPAGQPVWQARLHHSIGNSWMMPRQFDRAIEAYQSAEAALGGMPEEGTGEPFSLWIDLQLDAVWAYYWMMDVSSMIKRLERLEPVIDRTGTALQRATYYIRLTTMEFFRDRYWPDELALQHARQGLAAAQESGDQVTLGMAYFILGFCHKWRMELDQAIQFMEKGLSIAERIGDMERRVLLNTYLTCCFRGKKDIEAVKTWTGRSLAVAEEAKMPFYRGVAQANQAWIDFMEGNLERSEELARKALEVIPAKAVRLLAIWPLLAISLNRGQLDQAVELAEEIVHPGQARLPDSLDVAIRSAVDLCKGGEPEQSKTSIEAGIRIAQDLGYF
jgi:tetratricopeptide (TPR) repeat protein